jgi:hypothetical protein
VPDRTRHSLKPYSNPQKRLKKQFSTQTMDYSRQVAEKDPFYRNIMERFDHHFNQEEKDIDKKLM